MFYNKIIILLSCCFIGGTFITYSPNNFTNLIFPMCIYLILFYYTNKKIENFLPLLIIIIILPLLHIIVSISFIILLVSFIQIKTNYTNINRIVILATIISISWISTFYIWLQMINKLIRLFEDTDKTSAGAIIDQVAYAGQFNIDLISYIFFTYGITIILFISFITILYYSMKIKNNIINNFNKYYILISTLIIIQLFMYTGFSPLRFLIFLNIIAIFYLGLIIFKSISINKFHYSKVIAGIFILIIFTTGLLTVFPSTTTLLPNYQTTTMEMDGVKWLFKQSDPTYNITGISIAPGRYASFVLEDNNTRKSQIPLYLDDHNTCPYHFYYDEFQYSPSSYLLLTKKDRVLYTEVYPSMAESRWNDNDFEKLNFFTNINKVYSNSDVDCWVRNGV